MLYPNFQQVALIESTAQALSTRTIHSLWGFFSRIGNFLPTLVSPTPVSPTHKKLYNWYQCDVKPTSWSGLMSLKIYLGHIKVTSCAMTGFVCIKSCSWVYQPVQVNHVLVQSKNLGQKFNSGNLWVDPTCASHHWLILGWSNLTQYRNEASHAQLSQSVDFVSTKGGQERFPGERAIL